MLKRLALCALLAGCGGSSTMDPGPGPAEWHIDQASGWMRCNAPSYEEWHTLPDGQRQGACTWRCADYEGVPNRWVVLSFWRLAPPATDWHTVQIYVTPREWGADPECPPHSAQPAPPR
jgi:hypothetical protein